MLVGWIVADRSTFQSGASSRLYSLCIHKNNRKLIEQTPSSKRELGEVFCAPAAAPGCFARSPRHETERNRRLCYELTRSTTIEIFGGRWIHGSGLPGLFRLIASFLAFLAGLLEGHLNDGLDKRAEAE